MAKILVIDDDALIVELLRARLTDAGHQVVTAMDAYGATGVAAREKPDLITLDYQMPAGDGVVTLQRLRANTFTAKTPVIFVTAVNPGDILARVPDDRLVRVLRKPIDVDELLKMIRALLSPPAAAPQAAPPPPAAPPAPPPAAPPAPGAADKTTTDGGALGGDILDLDV